MKLEERNKGEIKTIKLNKEDNKSHEEEGIIDKNNDKEESLKENEDIDKILKTECANILEEIFPVPCFQQIASISL